MSGIGTRWASCLLMISFLGTAEQGARIVRLRPATHPGTPGAAMPGASIVPTPPRTRPTPPGRVLPLGDAEGVKYPVMMIVNNLNIRIINPTTGELLRQLTLNPDRDYQPQTQQ